jgi:L-fucose isomerase
MKEHEMHNRLQGRLPKIGIRPTIDGRRKGVRESLEKQTMEMAKSLKKFLSENLRYPNGHAVDCIISNSCIGGVAEAARAQEKFAMEGVGVTITVTPCWCYGAETMDMDPHTQKAVWGFNGTERPGAVYLAAVLAANAQKGLPAFSVYGRDVQDADDSSIPGDVQQKLLQFAKSGIAVTAMRGKSYLAMGGVSMGIAGSIVDPGFLEEYLGMCYEMVDMSEFVRRIDEEIYDVKECEKALQWVKESCIEGPDLNKPHYRFTEEEKKKR